MGLIALLAMAVTFYAQQRLPVHAGGHAVIARGALLLTGAAMGALGVWMQRLEGLAAVLVFIIGVGVVHVPAAFILYMKRQRGEYDR